MAEQKLTKQAVNERRREPRQVASGTIRLTTKSDEPLFFQGELVNVSESGFSVRHHQTRLHAGLEVHYVHSQGQGSARVMWTRILRERVESGFVLTRTA
jgi:hypothetical protein